MDTIWKASYLLQLMEEALVKPCAMKREVWQPTEAVSTSVIIGIQVCTIDDWRHVQVNKLRNSQKRASCSAPRLLGVKNISWSKGKSGQTRLTYNCAHLIRSTKESLTFEYDIWWFWVSRRGYWLVLGGTGSVEGCTRSVNAVRAESIWVSGWKGLK